MSRMLELKITKLEEKTLAETAIFRQECLHQKNVEANVAGKNRGRFFL